MADAKNRHQQLYKKSSTPPWKETFRNRCLARMRRSRARLVDEFRQSPVGGEAERYIPDLVDNEWDAFQREQMLEEEEFIDKLMDVRNAICQELLDEKKQIAAEYEASLEFERQIDQSIVLESDKVLCPLCQMKMLRQSASVIHCSCGLLVDTEQDGLTLWHLKQQLMAGIQSHNAGCTANPVFSQSNAAGITNLLLSCATCDFLFVVI